MKQLKRIALILLLLLTAFAATGSAVADGVGGGSFVALAVGSGPDLDGDGLPGRNVHTHVVSFSFDWLEGTVDTTVDLENQPHVPGYTGDCAVGELELQVSGFAILYRKNVFEQSGYTLAISPQHPPICAGLNPEPVEFEIVNAWGNREGDSGVVRFVFYDNIMHTSDAGAPDVVRSVGEFDVVLD